MASVATLNILASTVFRHFIHGGPTDGDGATPCYPWVLAPSLDLSTHRATLLGGLCLVGTHGAVVPSHRPGFSLPGGASRCVLVFEGPLLHSCIFPSSACRSISHMGLLCSRFDYRVSIRPSEVCITIAPGSIACIFCVLSLHFSKPCTPLHSCHS